MNDVDELKANWPQHIPKNLHPKEYANQLRHQCQSLRYLDKLLKDLAPPLWELEVKDWTPQLEKWITTDGQTLIFILNTEAISASIRNGDKPRPPNNLDTTLSTLKATLSLLANHEHRKLPKDTTTHTQAIHESWHQYIGCEIISSKKHPTVKQS